MVELKPCPLSCGGEVKRERRQPGGTGASGMEPYMQRIACTRCGVALPWEHPKDEWGNQAKHDKTLSAAQEAKWNRRAERPAGGVDVTDEMVFLMSCWMARDEGHDDPHHLIWEGSPPEPWGEAWNRYEDRARAALTAALSPRADSAGGA